MQGKVHTLPSLMAETTRLASHIDVLRKTFTRKTYGSLTVERLEEAEKRAVLLHAKIRNTRFKHLVPKDSITGIRRFLLNANYIRQKRRILRLIQRVRLLIRKSESLLSKQKFIRVYRRLGRAESTGKSAHRAMQRLEVRISTALNTATSVQIQKKQMKM